MISLQNIQVEVDAGYLYAILSENESDPNIAEVFRQMSIIEQGHAEAFMAKNNLPLSQLAKLLVMIIF
jgi:rubrerythrin